MVGRITKLRRLLARENLDGLVVTDLSNVRYLSGFTGSNGMLLVTRTAAWFFTDFRYKEQIKTEVKGVRKQVRARSLFTDFPVEYAAGLKRLGVERHNLTLGLHELIRRAFRGSGTRLVSTANLVLELRRTKSAAEVAAIAVAQAHTDRMFSRLRKLIRPGVRESDLAAEITFRFAKHGGNAFAPIVASGPNGSRPHAGASSRRLRNGDAVTMDFGCRTGGYCSDMTRTVFVGRPDPDLLEVYRIVHEAQRRGIAAIRPGVAGAAVDRAARQYITDTGYGAYFGHSLGHGVGIDVHEQPVLAPRNKQRLQVGDVVTVEPGIYIPGLGGVRIEDMVLVTRNGCRNLTRSTKRVLTI